MEDFILRAGFEPTMSYVNDAGNIFTSSFSKISRSDQDRSNQESKDFHIFPKPTSGPYSAAVPLDHSGIVVGGCIGDRTRSVGLTPVDWTSHPFRNTAHLELHPWLIYPIYITTTSTLLQLYLTPLIAWCSARLLEITLTSVPLIVMVVVAGLHLWRIWSCNPLQRILESSLAHEDSMIHLNFSVYHVECSCCLVTISSKQSFKFW